MPWQEQGHQHPLPRAAALGSPAHCSRAGDTGVTVGHDPEQPSSPRSSLGRSSFEQRKA